MNKKQIIYIYTAILAMLMFVPSIFAQESKAPIQVLKQVAEKESEMLNTSFDIMLDDKFKLGANDMIILTPVLKSNTSDDSLVLEPMVVMGKTRDKVIRRNQKYRNASAMPNEVFSSLLRKNKSEQLLSYNSSVAYSSWMRNAQLELHNTASGCADCETDLGIMPISARLLPNIEYIPSYKLTFIVPEVEPVKARSDKHSATFNFVVNRYELLRDFKDNRSKFDEVDAIIREVQGDE